MGGASQLIYSLFDPIRPREHLCIHSSGEYMCVWVCMCCGKIENESRGEEREVGWGGVFFGGGALGIIQEASKATAERAASEPCISLCLFHKQSPQLSVCKR